MTGNTESDPNLARNSGFLRGHELRFKLAGRHRPAEEIALSFLTSHGDEQIGNRTVLDSFRDNRQTELPAESDGRADDRRIIGVREQVEHERPVDLQSIERELLQVAEAGVAGAEIVEHETN